MKLLTLAAMFTFLLTQTGFAIDRVLYDPPSGHIGEGVLKVDLPGDLLLSSARLDVDGNEVEFSDEEAYTHFEGSVNFHYGMNKYLEILGGVRGRLILAENDLSSVTNTNIESALLGFKFSMLPTKTMEASFYSKFRQSLFSNDTDLTQIANGEVVALGFEGTELTFGGALTYYLGKTANLHFDVAYNLPPDSLSHEVWYRTEFAFLGNSVGFQFGVDGIMSMNQEETGVIKDALGSEPSGLYNNSINRSRMRPYVGLSFKLGDQWRFRANGYSVVSGSSTDKGIGGFGAITYYSKSPQAKRSKGREAKFKEYDLEGTVIKASRSGRFIKVDQGASQGVTKGMKVDFYLSDYFGGNVLIAAGRVYETSSGWSIVKVLKRYRKKRVKKGMVARLYK